MVVMTTMMTGRQLLRKKEKRKKKVRKPKYESEKSKKKYSTLQRGKKLNECFLISLDNMRNSCLHSFIRSQDCWSLEAYLTEAEDIKKRWQEYTEELYKKDLHHPDNHDDVITNLEPDFLVCEVKWALESITMNKANGGDGIQLSCFKSWKMMLWKCYTQYASKFGKLSSGHRTGKGQFSFQSQRKAMQKNAQTTAQLHSSHMLVK